MLKKLGYDVTVFTDSVLARETFFECPSNFDLIVTDQNMPHLTGTMLADEISKSVPEIPIILLSGFVDSVVGTASRSASIQKVLSKPVTKEEMSVAIRELLD